MKIADPRTEYERRMHAVQRHIDQHLDEPLDLATLAQVAHFSPFHFHRLFAAWMGETLGEHLRRRRLEVAAMRMVAQPRLPLLPLALAVGFGSQEAFSRAFKAHFGLSPSAWRRTPGPARQQAPDQDSNPDQVRTSSSRQHPGSNHPPRAMNVHLNQRPAVQVAYLRHLGPYGIGVSDFWQQQVYPWMARNGWLQQPRYGISHDDPGITAPDQCRYDACIELPADFKPSRAVLSTRLPAARYAELDFFGPVGDLQQAWNQLLRDWLPASGWQLGTTPCFEYYPANARFDPETGAFECRICIPVVPL